MFDGRTSAPWRQEPDGPDSPDLAVRAARHRACVRSSGLGQIPVGRGPNTRSRGVTMKMRVVSSAAALALALVGSAASQDNFGKRNAPETPSVIIAPALQPGVVAPQSSAPVVVQPAPP